MALSHSAVCCGRGRQLVFPLSGSKPITAVFQLMPAQHMAVPRIGPKALTIAQDSRPWAFFFFPRLREHFWFFRAVDHSPGNHATHLTNACTKQNPPKSPGNCPGTPGATKCGAKRGGCCAGPAGQNPNPGNASALFVRGPPSGGGGLFVVVSSSTAIRSPQQTGSRH